MAIQHITFEEALRFSYENVAFVDTRSPKEFAQDHIPGASNIPLFSNEERAIVGTLYKENQIAAYKKGFAVYNNKILALLEEFKKIDQQKKLIIYCWRGGMRSKTIAELIDSTGREVYQLSGGYKDFRAYVREQLAQPLKQTFLVLQGLAGCGKTDLIKKLPSSIDLEGLAQHRSSLFGAIGLHPVSQKMFESKLWFSLYILRDEPIIFIEGEAKKVGNVFVPNNLFKKMQSSPIIRLQASMQQRVTRIIRDYFTHGEDEEIKRIIMKLKAYISLAKAEELCALVDKKEYAPVAQFLLEEYYDPRYNNILYAQPYIAKVCTDNLNLAKEELFTLKKSFKT